MYRSVKSVIPNEDYILSICFNNGECGILDMKPFLNFGVFRKLKDRSVFKQVRVVFDTVEWDSGIDLDSDSLVGRIKRA